MSSALLERHRVEARTPGPCPVVATSRLVLRPHRLSDADSIVESLGDFAVARMLAQVPQPYDRQDALDWLQAEGFGAGLALEGYHVAYTLPGGEYAEKLTFFEMQSVCDAPFSKPRPNHAALLAALRGDAPR